MLRPLARHHARRLGRRFGDQHARDQGTSGEVTREERLAESSSGRCPGPPRRRTRRPAPRRGIGTGDDGEGGPEDPSSRRSSESGRPRARHELDEGTDGAHRVAAEPVVGDLDPDPLLGAGDHHQQVEGVESQFVADQRGVRAASTARALRSVRARRTRDRRVLDRTCLEWSRRSTGSSPAGDQDRAVTRQQAAVARMTRSDGDAASIATGNRPATCTRVPAAREMACALKAQRPTPAANRA